MKDPRGRDRSGFLFLQGRGTSPGIACGPLRRNRTEGDLSGARGSILVAERATPEDTGRILASAGTLTLGGAVLSHVSILSREFGKPSVSLGSQGQARILGEDERGLLELTDVVGEEAPPVLDEGDVVLLSGDEGTVRVPGGSDAAVRARVRRVHEHLREYARWGREDALLALLHEAGEVGSPPFAYLLEAAFLHRLVAPGRAAREFLRALGDDRERMSRLEESLGDLKERVLAGAREDLDRAEEELRTAEALDDLERAVRRIEGETRRACALLEDLGDSAEKLSGRLSAALGQAAIRRQSLRRKLGKEIAAAVRLEEDGLARRLGGLFQLLRAARAARLDEADLAPLERRLNDHVAGKRAQAGEDLIVTLAGSGKWERALVGGKAAGLIEVGPILPEGCRLPRGFVVTTAAYRLHLLGETGERLRRAVEDGGEEARISRLARAAILSGKIPEEVARAVGEAFHELGAARVAVRSSATVEDAHTGSLAGQFDTVLGVGDLQETLQRIRQTWASLWNARAIRTLAAGGRSPLEASQAVLVQELVDTRAAGVLVTRDPSGRYDTLLVNAAWGLGEAISQGETAGDLYWVERSSGRLLASESGGQSTRILLDPEGAGTVEGPLEPGQEGRPCLSLDDLGRTALLARALEDATGRAQDVEFGFTEEGGLVVFQVRRVVAGRGEGPS